jgi:glucoamylase
MSVKQNVTSPRGNSGTEAASRRRANAADRRRAHRQDRSEAVAARSLIWSTEAVHLSRRAARGSVVALTLALAFPLSVAPRVASAQTAAPDGPGVLSRYDLARKDCVGTAANRRSKVWYTVADGVLSDVYSPTIDNTNVQSLRFIVTDGHTFTDLQGRDTSYTVRTTDRGGMACEVTTTAANGRWRLVTEYVTDATRDSVVMRNKLVAMQGPLRDLRLYVRYDATMNGNGGGGAANGGADSAIVDARTTALVSFDTSTVSQALNRDYGVPLFGALRGDRPFLQATSGFAASPSDGLTQLDNARALTQTYAEAVDGNVVQTGQVDVGSNGSFTLALGYGQSQESAVGAAGSSAAAPFNTTRRQYVDTWQQYDAKLDRLPQIDGLDNAGAAYLLSANVLKASEDKTFPGAIVASLASPWGQAVSAGDEPGGRPVYFGSYREIFSRDLYEAFTGLLATGDLATARDSVRWLFERQQLPDGRFPRNSLVNGKVAPDTGGDQLDETSYPILMALQAGLDRDAGLWPRIKKAADFVVSRGPAFGSERWEEQSGFSPSTIAAEIAGLVAAGVIGEHNGDAASSRVYYATADDFARRIKEWTVTTSRPLAPRYFIRLSRNGDPNEAVSYNLGNGSISADQREVIDAGFLELTRLGILPPDDPDVLASLDVVDEVIRVETRSGSGFYRYGTLSAGTEDGYGDCWEDDPTNCAPSGRPWPTGNSGSGHYWPVLSGERAQHEIATGDRASALTLAGSMLASSWGVGLVPEQSWENPQLDASPFGSDPAVASIGFTNGEAAGSATPLTWAQAQLVRLLVGLTENAVIEQPAQVRARYVEHAPPTPVPVTIISPSAGSLVTTETVTVTGTTEPGATVDVSAYAADADGATTTVTTAAGANGSYSVDVPTPFGTNFITVAATTSSGTGRARVTVVSDFIEGTTVLDVDDPSGDDDGPGTYAYPTSGDFHDGAFDIERFQVIDAGDRVFLRTTLRDLTPTFGSPLGAQLLDIFVRDPAAALFSSDPPFPSRNYRIADDSAWSQRIEVEGFAAPHYVAADGSGLGQVTVTASDVSKAITVIVPKASLGQPGSGWVFTVVLHGQDGFSGDRARGFAPTPQVFLFGVCAAGGTSPICAVDPGLVPKAMDVITPAGVDQTVELDPTLAPVLIQGVPVP